MMQILSNAVGKVLVIDEVSDAIEFHYVSQTQTLMGFATY
jgi:hypothetical protein